MSAHYDQKYDMPLSLMVLDVCVLLAKRSRRMKMRGTGVEPVSLAAPDPKSDPTPIIGGAPEYALATEHHRATPNDTRSTTESTTCRVSPLWLIAENEQHEGKV